MIREMYQAHRAASMLGHSPDIETVFNMFKCLPRSCEASWLHTCKAQPLDSVIECRPLTEIGHALKCGLSGESYLIFVAGKVIIRCQKYFSSKRFVEYENACGGFVISGCLADFLLSSLRRIKLDFMDFFRKNTFFRRNLKL